MKVLVTGSNGFVGKNLVAELTYNGYEILPFDLETSHEKLLEYTKVCEFVFHLAGVNRPQDDKDFIKGNVDFTSQLLDSLKRNKNNCPVLITSSIQAALNNPYGLSKRKGEELMFKYSEETDAPVYVYRLPNLFGKWSKPNYNTVVATFCHNIARDIEIQMNDRNYELNLCYIDDLLEEFMNALNMKPTKDKEFCYVRTTYKITLGELADSLFSFKKSRGDLSLPELNDPLQKKLYSTYLSFLPTDAFSYPLKMNVDNRGSFTEFFRTDEKGQVAINVSKPGITKGNHWHHTKNEKFLVVKGTGVIRFRNINSNEIIEYRVSDEKLEVVDIPTGYTHSIENVGNEDMVTVIWVNESFNKDKPDTYYLEV